jgi:Tfp pilus assembly protein PilF
VVVWEQLASVARTLARNDLALEAYRHLSELKPSDPSALLGVAEILLRERKFDEAKTEAAAAADLAVADVPSRANAHELLARIAIARHDLDTAREEAAAAQQIEPTRPIASFVEGRILYEQGKYGDALPLLEQAMADARKNGVRPIADLHYYAGDAMMRVDRQDDADAALSEEIRLFPQNVRARASLATLRHSSGDAEAVESIIDEMLRLAPTPESYALATRLWTSFGRSRQAEATRLEGRKLFGDARLRGAASH